MRIRTPTKIMARLCWKVALEMLKLGNRLYKIGD